MAFTYAIYRLTGSYGTLGFEYIRMQSGVRCLGNVTNKPEAFPFACFSSTELHFSKLDTHDSHEHMPLTLDTNTYD